MTHPRLRHLIGLFYASLICLALTCVSLAAEQPCTLKLEAQINGEWLQVTGRKGDLLLLSSGNGSVKLEESIPVRLIGNLAENLAFFRLEMNAALKKEAQPNPATVPDKWQATLDLDTGYMRWKTTKKTKTGGEHWKIGNPMEAICVVAKVSNGQTQTTLASTFHLGKGGQPLLSYRSTAAAQNLRDVNYITLCLEKGRFIPASTDFDDPIANEISRKLALGMDAQCALTIDQLKNPDSAGRCKDTLLHYAAITGAIQTMDALLAKGAKPSSHGSNGRTPVHYAIAMMHDVALDHLLDKNADPEASDKEGTPPLQFAISLGNTHAVKSLLAHNASVTNQSKEHSTPLVCAMNNYRSDAFSLLLESGAKAETDMDQAPRVLITQTIEGQRPIVQALLGQNVNPNFKYDGHSALMFASMKGFSGIASDLIEAKADVQAGTTENITALHYAALQKHREVAELLLAAGANPNTKTNTESKTPLHLACYAGSLELAKTLVDAGADINALTSDGASPLGLALGSGSRELTKFLIEKGSRVDLTSPLFNECAWKALAIDSKEFLEAAIKAGLRSDTIIKPNWSVYQVAKLLKATDCIPIIGDSQASSADVQEPTVYPLGKVDRLPKLCSAGNLFDPRSKHEKDAAETAVDIDVIIDEKGTALFPKADCPDCRLSLAAVRCIETASFSPALKDGKPVISRGKIPVIFPDKNNKCFIISNLDELPEPLKTTPPKYPEALRTKNIEGLVEVEFVVDETGLTSDVRAIKTTHPGFSESAEQAVAKWKFTPGKYNGKAVSTKMSVPVEFELE